MKRERIEQDWIDLFQMEEGQADKTVKRYRTRTTTSGPVREVEIYPIWDTRSGVRRERGKASSEAQRAYNEKRVRRQITRLMNANFSDGDLMLTLTYKGGAVPDMGQAQRDVRNYLRRIKRWREKRGLEPLKYLYVIEHQDEEGRKKRVHHHVVINAMPREAAEELWQRGRCNSMRLQTDSAGLTGLAQYLTKGGRRGKRWAASRSLKKPKTTYSDHKISAARAHRMARDFGAAGREILERIMPAYSLTEGEARWSEWVSGCYIYAVMRRRE